MAVKGTQGTNNLTQQQQQQQDCRQYYTLGTDSFEEEFECDEPVDVPIERLKLTLKEEEELKGWSKRRALGCVFPRIVCLLSRGGGFTQPRANFFLIISPLHRMTTMAAATKPKFPPADPPAFWRRLIWAAARTGSA